MKKLFSIFFIAAFGGFVAISVDKYLLKEEVPHPLSAHQTVKSNFVGMPTVGAENSVNFVEAADRTVNAVVHVKTSFEVLAQNNYYYDPFRDFFWGNKGQTQKVPQVASGSGVIISNDGYIVTNNHVINKAQKIEVTLNDNRTYPANLIGKDPATDLALLKIEGDDFPFLGYGNSDDVKIGEWVLAVGNPFNLTSTVTAGIVSAKARNINILEYDPSKGIYPIESFIQTDAAVNQGNSGGALVNTNGELIGINSAIASNTGSYAGYSFAIPVNIVSKVIADLLEFGEVQRAFIGVSIRDINSKLAEEKNLKKVKGVYVATLAEGGAAQEAGMQEGDVITKIGAVEISNVPELQEQISTFRPGDKIMVTVLRNDDEKSIPVILKNKNGNTALVHKEEATNLQYLGANFSLISSEEAKKLNINSGLKINSLDGGKLRSAGIKEGFIITAVDKKKIASVEDLKEVLLNKKGGVLIEGIYPNGMKAYYGFGM